MIEEEKRQQIYLLMMQNIFLSGSKYMGFVSPILETYLHQMVNTKARYGNMIHLEIIEILVHTSTLM